MGRGVDILGVNEVLEKFKIKGFRTVIGKYSKTKKNDLVKDFYKDLGFKKSNDEWTYRLEKKIIKPNFITVEE